MFVNTKRYLSSLPIDDGKRSLLLAAMALTLIFILVNTWLSWDQVGQPFSGQTAAYSLLQMDSQEATAALTTRPFTIQYFIQQVAMPALIIFIIIAGASILIYLRPDLLILRLFGLYILATICFVAGQPYFVTSGWFYLNSVSRIAGTLLMPPLLVHFLWRFSFPKISGPKRDFLLLLIYLPLPLLLVYLVTRLSMPQATHSVEFFTNLYINLYIAGGLISLLAAYRLGDALTRKKTIILLMGFMLPVGLLALDLFYIAASPAYLEIASIYNILRRYVFGAIPLFILLTILRYDIFDLSRASQRQIFYVGAVALILALSTLLIGLSGPLNIGFHRLHLQDLSKVLLTIIVFLGLRFLYRWVWQWWLERHLTYRMEDFRINLRILSGELLKVKSRYDLEAIISWNLPNDFRLQSAELSSNDIPNSHYALRLPLRLNNVSLGTLFLGPKITGDPFTVREREIFSEVQQQICLTVFSLTLDEAIHTTEALTRLKSKFLANVTHELRTPLNAIINYIGFVIDDADGLNQEQIDHLKHALHSAERLFDLINNILDMSKIEAGQMMLLTRPVDLTQLVTETMPVVDDLRGDKPIEIITNITPNLPMIQGDYLRLRQIVVNMLSNAIKFTERGVVQLSLYPDNGDVIIEVADTGRGIEDEILPTIFQGFRTAELTDVRQISGAGLGLLITKYLVELHEGRIKVVSQIGVGTTCIVNLPINEVEKN